MKEYKEETRIMDVLDKTVCDKCGVEAKKYESFIEIYHHFGYGSEYDNEYWEIDLCEKCLLEVIKKSNITVRKYENGISKL